MTTPFGTHDPKTAAVNAVEAGEGGWQPISTAPEGQVTWTKIDDVDGMRNVQRLVKRTRIPGKTNPLWWTPGGAMYVYYTPTHWCPDGAPPATER